MKEEMTHDIRAMCEPVSMKRKQGGDSAGQHLDQQQRVALVARIEGE